MKKLFTLVAIALLGGAVSVNAQTTLIDFNNEIGTITPNGTSEKATVKIHGNADAVPCLKLNNGYTTDDVVNGNYIMLETEGGFKSGDVITIAGVINNSDNGTNDEGRPNKRGAVIILSDITDGEEVTDEQELYTTQLFINSRFVTEDPVPETYTLTADCNKLYLGRDGNTGTNITTLTIVRGTSAGITNITTEEQADPNAPIYNLAGQRVTKDTKGVLIQNGKKFINK